METDVRRPMNDDRPTIPRLKARARRGRSAGLRPDSRAIGWNDRIQSRVVAARAARSTGTSTEEAQPIRSAPAKSLPNVGDAYSDTFSWCG